MKTMILLLASTLGKTFQKPMNHLSSQKSEMKHIPHGGHINIRCCLTKLGQHSNLAPEICALLHWKQYINYK